MAKANSLPKSKKILAAAGKWLFRDCNLKDGKGLR